MKKIHKENIADILSLTPMQEGMIFHYLQNPQSDLYFEQIALNISGRINIPLFEQAWNWVVQSNEMLRTLFHWEQVRNPLQIVLKKFTIKPQYFILTDRETSEKKKWLQDIKTRDRQNKFDLRRVPFRVTLCKIEEHQYEMIISNHHILYDGWSNGIILKEFFNTYRMLAAGKPSLKPLVKTKFKEFVRWIQSQDSSGQEEAWNEYLASLKASSDHIAYSPGAANQGPGKKRNRINIAHQGNHCLQLSREMKDKAESFVKNRNITMAALLYSIWGILLQQYNFSSDVIFDTTVSGRSAKVKDIENMVGLFINTLPLRVHTIPGENIYRLLSRVYLTLQKRGVIENRSPLTVHECLLERRQVQLFDSLVVLENYPLDRILLQENGPLKVNSFDMSGMTHYDLTVIVTIFDDIKVNITYNTNRFEEDFILRLSDYFSAIFREVLDNPDKTIEQLESLPEQEKNRLLSSTEITVNKEETVEVKSRGTNGDETEEVLARIWGEVLGKRPAPEDDFFEISGNSLALVRIYKKINELYPGKMKVNDFFENPSIRKLKKLLILEDDPQAATTRNVDEDEKQKEKEKEKKIRTIDF